MKPLNPIDWPTRIAPYLPKAFQGGRKPYLFVLAWLTVLILAVVIIFTPDEKLFLPRMSIIVLIVLQYLMFQWGATEEKTVTTVLEGYTVIVLY